MSKIQKVGTAALLLLTLTVFVAGAQEIIFSTSGSLGPGDSTNGSGDYQDVYRVRVTAGTTVEVIVASETLDTHIEATLPGGMDVYNDDYQGYNAGFARAITQTGTLEFYVSSLYGSDEGEYTVVVSELPPPREISLDSATEGTFGKSGGQSRRAHRYILYGNEGQRVTIELRSDDFDAYLEIEDSTGGQDYDDDGAGNLNSRLSFLFPEDGYVTITASSIGGDEFGSYVLSVAGGAETLVAEFEGNLDYGDYRGYDGTLYDMYEFEGEAGESITIMLNSDYFDARLFFSNPDGSNLASDDDGGGGSNSLVSVILPETGTYRIFVTSFFEGTGDYLVQIMK